MRTRFATYGVVASLAGMLSSAGPAERAAQVPSGGSEVPCAVPLAWRVARVDEEFGVDVRDATRAVQAAADLWEAAVGQELFRMDPDDGFPVRLVYDERQARSEDRRQRVEAIERAGALLEARGEELRLSAERLGEAQAAHNERRREYEARVGSHNENVRRWNERGGAPESVQRQLAQEGEALDAARSRLESDTRALQAEARALQDRQGRLNRDVREHNGAADEVARAYPPTAVESGVYREALRTVDGRITSVSREIRIFRFATAEELRLVVAHELGHALGLGHSPEGAAVMNEQHGEGVGRSGPVRVHAADLDLLGDVCPALVAPGR